MIGAAIIGSGFIGALHLGALRRLGIEVRGVLGSSADRGAERARALGVPRAYASLDEMLADDGVQVAHVTSPTHAPSAGRESGRSEARVHVADGDRRARGSSD